MRLRLIFNVKNPGAIIPFHHQYLLSDFFRSLLRKGEDEAFKNFNLYNFSGIKGNTEVIKEGLRFTSKKATIVFSSNDENFLDYFVKVLFKEKFIPVGPLFLEADEVEKELPVPMETDNFKFICLSPIVIVPPFGATEEVKRFIDPATDEFSDLVYESTLTRLEQSGKFSEEDLASFNKFQLIPDKEFLAKIKVNGKKFSRIFITYIDRKPHEVRGYTLPFTLYASPQIQDFIFNNGLGELTSNGFGMLDLAKTAFAVRTVPFKSEDKIQNAASN